MWKGEALTISEGWRSIRSVFGLRQLVAAVICFSGNITFKTQT